jgi:hypothetical protein
MGIYNDGFIYGVRIINYIDSESNVLFERMFHKTKIISDNIMNELQIFYNSLHESDKNETRFQIYTNCGTTYNDTDETCMIWMTGLLDNYLQKYE